MTQIAKHEYTFEKYTGIDRFSSYWYQLREIMAAKPNQVLEVGVGEAVVANYLKAMTNIAYTSADFADDLSPDVIADVRALPFADDSYDMVCAFEVLEHLPFDEFEKAVSELVRVSKKTVLISLPHFGPPVFLRFKFPFLPEVSFAWKVPYPKEHHFNGQHYWEIGKKGYPVSRIRSALKKHATLIKEFIPFENQYHHFFVLEITEK
jgi:predicted SAM-dependent methyltransferase